MIYDLLYLEIALYNINVVRHLLCIVSILDELDEEVASLNSESPFSDQGMALEQSPSNTLGLFVASSYYVFNTKWCKIERLIVDNFKCHLLD